MIVFPQGLVAELAVTAAPLTHGRIGYKTFTRGALPSSVTVSGDTPDGPADAPLRPDTNEYWQGPSLPATWTFIFPGGLADVNYAGVAGHTVGSSGAAIKAETSPDGAAWEDLGGEVSPADDSPIMFLDSVRSANRLRLTLTGAGAVPRVAVVYVEKTLDFYRPIYGGHSPLSLSRDTVLQSSVSRGGQFLGQTIQSMGVHGSVQLNNMPAAWYRANFDPFVEVARSFPYFYAWRPQTFPLEVVYLWNTADLSPSNQGKRDLMEVSWNVRGIGWVRNA